MIRNLLAASSQYLIQPYLTLDIFGDNSCKALYALEDNALDESGNYNGTATSVTYGNGISGRCGVFNGSSSKVVAPALGFSGNVSISFSAWVKFNIITAFSICSISDANGGIFNNKIIIGSYDSSGKIGVIQNGGFVLSNTALVVNTFTHVVVTRNSANGYYSIYINGVLDKYALPSETFAGLTNAPFYIGYNSFSTYANGSIDQVRIFNRALTADEVTTLYTKGA